MTKLWIENNKIATPNDLKYIINELRPFYNSNLQHDSNEFMLQILELLHEDVNVSDAKLGKKQNILSYEPKEEHETNFDASKRFWNNFTQNNKSIITSLFYGQIKNEIKCLCCGYSNCHFEPFLSLPIQIPILRKINVFLVPSTNIKETVELSLFISENALFIDIGVYLKQYIKEGFERFKTLLFTASTNSVKFVKLSENIYNSSKKSQIFIFEISNCVYDDDNEDYFPFITLINTKNQPHISYPRILPVNSYGKVRSIRVRLFSFLRKYYPLTREIEEMTQNCYANIVNAFHSNNKSDINDTEIENAIEKEYSTIFSMGNTSTFIQEYLSSFPFKAYLMSSNPNSESKLFFSNDIKEYSLSFADNQPIENVIEFARNGYKLVIEIETDNYTQALNQMTHIISSSDEKVATLDDALIDFGLYEKLDKGNEWYCPRCKKNQNAYKRLEIFYLSKYFIIMIKRFVRNYLGKNKVQLLKVNDMLDYPTNNLDMSPFCLGPKDPQPVFDLFAVSQHSGSSEGGRYAAACKNFGKWYIFDDASYFKSETDAVVTPDGYILFYKKIKINK